jgi:hypothetical protein
MPATIQAMTVLPNDHVVVTLQPGYGRECVPVECHRCHNALYAGFLSRQGLLPHGAIPWEEVRRELPADFQIPKQALLICCDDTAVGVLEYVTDQDGWNTDIVPPDVLFFLLLFFNLPIEVQAGMLPEGIQDDLIPLAAVDTLSPPAS